MKTAVLTRTKTGPEGTFGVFTAEGRSFVTGELPDKGNAAELSCIPAGKYVCKWTFSNRFKREMYQVCDVPGRTGIRFHSANLMGDESAGFKSEVQGCIALGGALGVVRGQKGIVGSRSATEQFESLMGGEDFQLTIVDEYLEAGAPSEHPFS